MSLWPHIRPILERAIPRALGRFDVADLLYGIVTGQYDAWVVASPGEGILGAGLATILPFPRKRVYYVLLYAGDRKRGMALWPQVEAYARDVGCSEVQIAGPRAWGRIFRSYNESFTTFTREVS